MITPVLIAKYFEGNCTSIEVKEVEDWLKKSPDNEKTFKRLKTIWEETGKVRPINEVKETEAAWLKLKTKIKRNTVATPKWKSLSFILPRAAAAVLVFTSMIIFYLTQTSTGSQVVKMIEISTQKGEKRQLALADGSTVWLNAESSIKYPENFAGDAREVYLEGEAYFDIEKDVSKPFKVHTNDITTKVLGTQFNVLAYAEQENIVVALDEGKVAVNYSETEMLLEPGKQIAYNKLTHKLDKSIISGKHNQWRNNVLALDNITLLEATLVIERWFGTKVIIDNEKLEKCLVTASFTDPDIKTVIEILTSILSLENKEVDGVYHIDGESCL